MIFNLKNPYEKDDFKNYANKLYLSESVVELTKKLPNRTLAQNSYLHLLLGFFASEYGCSLDEVKLDFFKREVNKAIFQRTITNKLGKEITTLRSTTDLTTGEMSTAIDRFRNWSSAVAGIYLPSANDKQFLVYVQQEIEHNKVFI